MKDTSILRFLLVSSLAAGTALTAYAGYVTYVGPTGEPVRWGESASNWSPARLPGADDRAVVNTADLVLESGDSYTVSNASVACAANASAKITINAGASLSFASASAENLFADASGATTIGAGNVVNVHNGGHLNLGADKTIFGKGRYDFSGATRMSVTGGGSVMQDSAGTLYFGDGDQYSGGGGSGGEILIDGGSFTAGNRIIMNCARYDTSSGYAVIRIKNGSFSFSGSMNQIDFWGGVTNAIIQSGGSFEGSIAIQDSVAAKGDALMEVSGCATNTAAEWRFGTSSGNNSGRIHLRIVGRDCVVKVGKGSFHTPYNDSAFTEPPMLVEFVVDPSTRRNSDYPMTPVYVTTARYNGGYGGIRGVHHVRHQTALPGDTQGPMYVKAHDGFIDGQGTASMESTDGGHGFCRYRYGADDQYQTVGEDMWDTDFLTVNGQNFALGTTGYMWQMRQKLKSEAALADGAAALATPVVRGYLALPAITTKDLRDMKRGSIRLALIPGTGETLESLVAGFRANGYPGSVVETDGIYNVRLDIPVERLLAGVATDKVLFDFSEYPNYNAAKTKSPTVRATIAAAKWDPKIDEPATVLYVR